MLLLRVIVFVKAILFSIIFCSALRLFAILLLPTAYKKEQPTPKKNALLLLTTVFYAWIWVQIIEK